MNLRRFAALGACCTLAGVASAQVAAPPGRVHDYLEQQLAQTAPTEQLPVYFVLADRLDYDHWFPRVQRLGIDERRALVVAELRAHAERTQAALLQRLSQHAADGGVTAVSSNWLGNFVSCRATPAAVMDAALIDGIEEVRFNARWPGAEVLDGSPSSAPAPAGLGTPSNGVLNTRADQVWALGFTGHGVIVMNADSGINVSQGDLVNVLWTNPGEVPGNGIDDDGNGYVDDIHGWNFFDDNDDIEDGGGHGTQTAGTRVGDGACSGTTTGQAPGGRVMTAALGPGPPQTGPFTPLGEVAQWDAVQYAILMGAHVQTSSHSYKNAFTPPPNYEMHRVVGVASLAAGLIRTNSTGNNGASAFNSSDLNRLPFNVSAPGNLPPPYIAANQTLVGARGGVLAVGAHDVSTNLMLSYTPFGPSAWHVEDVLMVNPAYPLANWSPNHNDYPWFGGNQQGLLKPDLSGPTGTTTTTGAGSACGLTNQTGTSNATPRVAGTLMLWKGANMSLGPEDMALIAHQTASSSGGIPGKENRWGAGRVDALEGLYLALCTHRVNGEAVWSLDASSGPPAWELDTVPNSNAVLSFGTERRTAFTSGGVVGLAGQVVQVFSGSSGPTGDLSVQVAVPPALRGVDLYSQWFTDDTAGATGLMLSSNVIRVGCAVASYCSYCTAGTSTNGCQATLSADGTASATASSGFDLLVSDAEGARNGIFFFGTNGRQANAWGNGTSFQCVVAPVRRAGLQVGTGTAGQCDGGFTQDLNALWCPTCPKPAKNPGAGALVQAQLWYRDPLNTSNQTTSLSDAIEFAVGP